MAAMLFIFVSFAAADGPTLINLIQLAQPGAAGTILNTDSNGDVAWTGLNSLFTGGTGVTVEADGTITNDNPDQTVTFAETGAISITGTYPNFNVDVTENDGSDTNESQGMGLSGSSFPKVTLDAANGAGGGEFILKGTGALNFSVNGDSIIANVPDSAAPTLTVDRYEETLASSSTSITVSGFTPSETTTLVFVDGVQMDIGAGQDATLSGSTYTFSSSLVSGQKFLAKHISVQ